MSPDDTGPASTGPGGTGPGGAAGGARPAEAGAGQAGQPPVGSLAEEAARLLGALQDLATTTGHEPAAAAGAALGGAAAGLREAGEHLAGAPECRYCPLCRVLAAVRGASPEVREHLATAGSALLSAAAALLATPVPDDRKPGAGPVQRIDLDRAEDGGEDDARTRSGPRPGPGPSDRDSDRASAHSDRDSDRASADSDRAGDRDSDRDGAGSGDSDRSDHSSEEER